MPHADLPIYQDAFFERFLGELPGAPTRDALEQRQPGQPLALLADYIEYQGPPLTPLPNASVTPRFALRTSADTAAQTFVMLWLVERFDVASDSEQTLARILADFRAPSAAGAAEEERPSVELAQSWARALGNDEVRRALARNLSEIASVPAGLPTQDRDELCSFLLHFGTYRPDGTYYAKGSAADAVFPSGVSEEYLRADAGNLVELQLQRDAFYCYALVQEQLWNPQAEPQKLRQLVYRIEDRGSDCEQRFRLALLHTIGVSQPGASGSRFLFFQAAVGLGLALPGAASSVVASSVASVAELLANAADLAASLKDPLLPIVGKQQEPYVLLIGAVKATFPSSPLPNGVIEDGEGAVRTFRCPPEHLLALAQRDDVEQLVASAPVWPTMQQAMAELKLAGRTLPPGVTAANTGKGVVVGIVDTGIDGGHPAFLGREDDPTKARIHSVWRLWESGGNSPFVRSGSNAVYRAMNFGREYLGHDEVTTCNDYDDLGGGNYGPSHGTHVSGIAAGRAFGTWPGGIAPGATLVVAGIGANGFVNDIVAGVKYCFQKATELGLPCVVNISMGTERHSHDGTDPLSIAITQLVSEDVVPAVSSTLPSAMPRYRAGRIVCAAAGNTRGDPLHWQATIPAGGSVSVLYQPFGRGVTSTMTEDGITFWAYNEDATSVRLRLSARHSSNAVLAAPEVPLMTNNGRVRTSLVGGLNVDLHNGPAAPNNRHYNPEIYWTRPLPGAPVATAPWIIRLRNEGRAACVVHGFAAYREHSGGFVFGSAQTNALLGMSYAAAELRRFESCKINTPGTAPGVLCVAAFTSRLPASHAASEAVDDIAWFSSPGPLRAVGPGQRGIACALPGHVISSAKSWTPADASRGVTDMSGTSMATPMLTGLVAGLLQQDRTLSTGQLLLCIENATTRRPNDPLDDWGLGRLDASRLRA